MVTIRLDRRSVRRKPFYRVVVTDKDTKKGGEALEVLGFWNPVRKEQKLDLERLNFWVGNGAQVSAPVKKLFSIK